MIEPVIDLVRRVRQLPKWQMFLTFVASAAAIAAVASLFTYRAVLDSSSGSPVKVALVAPMSGPDKAIGAAMLEGARQWAIEANAQGGVAGHAVSVEPFDEAANPDGAAAAVKDPQVLAVIGPFGADRQARAASVLAEARLAALLPTTLAASVPADAQAFLPLSGDALGEARFLANYVRNIVGEPLVSIIRPDTPDEEALADAFDQVMQRFGTRVVYKWALPPGAAKADIATTARGIVDQKLAGAILVLGPPNFAAHTVAALREAGVANKIVGPRALATRAFRDELQAVWAGAGSMSAALNGTLTATPVLFDTAGVAAQSFRTAYVQRVRQAPDWLAALSYDAARAIGTALAEVSAPLAAPGVQLREPLRAALRGHDRADRALAGALGTAYFDAKGRGAVPTLIGTYDGAELIASLTQLTPIHDEGVSNYLQELVAGRALYVNDRFMYKTNVAYSGIRLGKIGKVNTEANTAEAEFEIWFRWREGFDPQDIEFLNAVTPVKLGTPVREGKVGDFTYRAYRVSGTFYLNFSDIKRPYGSQLVEVSFRHRTLSRNNLMYVGDVLGMDLAGGDSVQDTGDAGWLSTLLGGPSERSRLAEQLEQANVLAGQAGWIIDRAWLSQDIRHSSSQGDPVFVGFGKPRSDFSTLSLGVQLKADSLDLRAMAPGNVAVYIAIFALAGTVLAALLDRKDRGQFWRMQTLMLRVVCWPALLMALGNLALDYALANFTPGTVRLVDLTNHALWWLVPARLAAISLERFLWAPLEAKTNRKVPNVIRMLSAGAVYVMAGFGVVAFVLGETITSLLATSGLLAMILGLAIQSNLNDIFSGIMLNVERAFVIRNRVKISGTVGEVADITWRTTKLRAEDGHLISLPNGVVAKSEIHNLSNVNIVGVQRVTPNLEFKVEVPPESDPAAVLALIDAAVKRVDGFAFNYIGAFFHGVVPSGTAWVATFTVKAMLDSAPQADAAKTAMWTEIWLGLQEAGVTWQPVAAPRPALTVQPVT